MFLTGSRTLPPDGHGGWQAGAARWRRDEVAAEGLAMSRAAVREALPPSIQWMREQSASTNGLGTGGDGTKRCVMIQGS